METNEDGLAVSLDNDQILYDLVVAGEWCLEPQLLDKIEEVIWQQRRSLAWKFAMFAYGSVSYMWDAAKTKFRYQTSFSCPPVEIMTLINESQKWHVALSTDGSLAAVAQENCIEIRSARDDFATVVARCIVAKTSCSPWRKLVWSYDNSLLAYADSHGDVQIFDVMGSEKVKIPQIASSGLNLQNSSSHAVCSLFFFPVGKDSSWDSELFIVTYYGEMRSYFCRRSGEVHLSRSFSFTAYHPYGVSAVVSDPKRSVLIVSGYGGSELQLDEDGVCYGSHCGISLWRLLGDAPHLALQADRGKGFKKLSGKDLLKKMLIFGKSENMQHSIFRMHLSPSLESLVTMDVSGRLSLWQVPSLKLLRSWHLSEQPYFSAGGFQKLALSKKGIDYASSVTDFNWWSDKALILARGNGSLTVSSATSLQNLLGESAESFDQYPSVTQAAGGHLLVLECENLVTVPGESTNSKEKTWDAEEDEDESGSMQKRLRELVKQGLYFLTESERFLPPVRKPRWLTRIYRLVCLKSTTPKELYARKIELEHYGDALELARRFKLSTDLVYQRQWRKKPATTISIHDYLTKIKDRWWVLEECLQCVPDDYDAMEELLKYGLRGTEWEIVEAIESNSDDQELPFLVKRKDEMQDDAETRGAKPCNLGTLSKKQIRLCRYRWHLLQYLDRLATYEVILGGSYKAREKFSADFFSRFRSCNIVHQAVEFARDSDSYAVEDIFSYHGGDVLSHWLPVISNFPETTPIDDYKTLIPEIGESPEDPAILPWAQKHHRETDWVEGESVFSQLGLEGQDDLGDFIYEEQPDLAEFRHCDSQEKLSKWFLKRVHDIEHRSKMVDNAHALVSLGISRGVKGLNDLLSNVTLLETLVYKVKIDSSLGLKECEDLSDLSKLKLLMSRSADDSFVKDFKDYARPFLDQIARKSVQSKQKLLHHFLLDIAKADLSSCLKLFQASAPGVKEPIIPDVAELMKLAMDCIIICKRDDQLDLAFSIVECLPSREEGILSGQIQELHNRLDQLELELGAAEILSFYDYPQTIAFIQESRGSKQAVDEIISHLVKNATSRSGSDEASKWNVFLKHLLKLTQTVFTSIDVTGCHKIIVEALLRSGSKLAVSLASEFIHGARKAAKLTGKEQRLMGATTQLDYDTSVAVIVSAAREYFNSALSFKDPAMELARLCLSLIRDSEPSAQLELDLIGAVSLMDDFSVSVLPLQVRLCQDRIEMIHLCLQAKPTNYRKIDKLLQLGKLMHMCDDKEMVEVEKERCGRIFTQAASVSLQMKDYSFTSGLCGDIMDSGYSEGWKICRDLGTCEDFYNPSLKKDLLSFSLTYCPSRHIESLMTAARHLETQSLFESIQKHISHAAPATGSFDVEAVDGHQSLLKKTTNTTRQIISTVADTSWLTGAMKWMRPLGNVTPAAAPGEEKLEHAGGAGFSWSPYYASVHGNDVVAQPSSVECYRSFLEHAPRLIEKAEFDELLLRSQMLIGTRAENGHPTEIDEAVSRLGEDFLDSCSLSSLGYLLSASKDECLQDMFDRQRNNAFLLVFASYCFALRLHAPENAPATAERSAIYRYPPKQLIAHVLKRQSVRPDTGDGRVAMELLVKNLTRLSDLIQAKTLQSIGKGVDVERFASDDKYKRETILGLAMHGEDSLMRTSLSLAERYDVPIWEVMLAHTEYLFVDSGLKVKDMQADLAKWNIEQVLKTNPDAVFERFKSFVYPELNGLDHALLLLFYTTLCNCCGPSRTLQGSLSVDSHVRLLRKVKAAAPGVDYKMLVHCKSPLAVLEGAIRESNVHLLAKLVAKIPQADGTTVSPNQVFFVYLKKLFWEGEKRDSGTDLDWIHRFEACQKFFSKLDAKNIVDFADEITFTEKAVDTLSSEIRMQITNRLLKYARQKKGEHEKAVAPDESGMDTSEYNGAIEHLSQSLAHLNSLQKPFVQNLCLSDRESHRSYARRYVMSRSEVAKIRHLASDMCLGFEPPEYVQEMLHLASEQLDHGWQALDAFKGVLHTLLQRIKRGENTDIFKTLLGIVKEHMEDGGRLVSLDDLLDVVRPFCSDVDVAAHVKREVLEMLEQAFDLRGEDIFLLMYYQTCAIVGNAWDITVESDELDSDEKRLTLFTKLLRRSRLPSHFLAIRSLLSSWPTLAASELSGDVPKSNPWIMLVDALISHSLVEQVIPTLREASAQIRLSVQSFAYVYEVLRSANHSLVANKVMIASGVESCHDLVFSDLQKAKAEDVSLDPELFGFIVRSGTVPRLVSTVLYPSFVEFSMTATKADVDVCLLTGDTTWERHSPDAKLEKFTVVSECVRQLHVAGFTAEAGTLLMRHRQSSQSFNVVGNAFQTIKWYFRK